MIRRRRKRPNPGRRWYRLLVDVQRQRQAEGRPKRTGGPQGGGWRRSVRWGKLLPLPLDTRGGRPYWRCSRTGGKLRCSP